MSLPCTIFIGLWKQNTECKHLSHLHSCCFAQWTKHVNLFGSGETSHVHSFATFSKHRNTWRNSLKTKTPDANWHLNTHSLSKPKPHGIIATGNLSHKKALLCCSKSPNLMTATRNLSLQNTLLWHSEPQHLMTAIGNLTHYKTLLCCSVFPNFVIAIVNTKLIINQSLINQM